MTASDLASIESALDVTLPAPYRAAMPAYPPTPADVNSQISLQHDARAITTFNRFLRDQFSGKWEPGYFAVGNSPAGDPYFLDLTAESPAVWSWDHESHEVAQEAPDFGSWIDLQRSLEQR